MKLNATTAQNSFKYKWLLSRILPYITPYWFRITLGFLVAIPLGLLDGVTAFALKPYMDYVIGGKSFEFVLLNQNKLQNIILRSWRVLVLIQVMSLRSTEDKCTPTKTHIDKCNKCGIIILEENKNVPSRLERTIWNLKF